jgi:hypothetical protein
VNRENLPTTMMEWKEATRKEVGRVKELQSTGLIGPRQNQPRDQHTYQTGNQHTSHSSSNNQHVPMDVDSANITVPFRKLTDEEHAKYCAEGRCFRCRIQGHMARNCPRKMLIPTSRTDRAQTFANLPQSHLSPPSSLPLRPLL